MQCSVSLTHRCVGQVLYPHLAIHLLLGSISSESAIGWHFLDNFSFNSKCAKQQYVIMAVRVSCPIRSFRGRSLPPPLLALWLQMNPFTFSASQFSLEISDDTVHLIGVKITPRVPKSLKSWFTNLAIYYNPALKNIFLYILNESEYSSEICILIISLTYMINI